MKKFFKAGGTKKLPPKLRRSHGLLRESLGFYWRHRRTLLPVVAVAITVNLLLRLASANDNAAFMQSLWFVFSSCAFVWAIRHAGDAHTHVTLDRAYYTGSAPAIKFLIVLAIISLSSIPFSIGLFLYAAVNSITAGAPSFWEQLIALGLWSVFGLGSVYLLARLTFSLVIVTLPDIRPLAAISLSWRLSRGKAVALATKLMIFVAYALLLVIIASLGMALVGLAATWMQLTIEVLSGLVILPLLYIYIFKMYQELQ